MTDLEQLRRELGQYFCEDEETFKLDDCIMTTSAFVDSFLKAIEVVIYSSLCSYVLYVVLETKQLIFNVNLLYFVL